MDSKAGRSPSPTTTISTFSFTSTMDGRVFREDGGRRFQAQSADEEEFERLNLQHYAFKAIQLGKNYLAPIDKQLSRATEPKRVLDVGTGTGIWAIELATEFPDVEFIGLDLAPLQPTGPIPNNVNFMVEDAAKPLPFPDEYFDVVHARAIEFGIRDWPRLLNEIQRVLKKGGLFCSVEPRVETPVIGVEEQQWKEVAPGAVGFAELLNKAARIRGYDVKCGFNTIPRLLGEMGVFHDIRFDTRQVPLWAWSEEPSEHQSGAIMIKDTEAWPDTLRLFIGDACNIIAKDYAEIKRDFMADLGRPGARTTLPLSYNWATKN